MKFTNPCSPSHDYIHLILSLPRQTASIITQLHTGHVPLNKYLFCIGKIPSHICPACHQLNGTVLHYILHCPAYHIPRQILHYEMGGSNLNLHCLLTKPEPFKALAKYIAQTHRFDRPTKLPIATTANSQQ